MTIADDMRAASLGELNRVRAQLKTANEEIEQLRGVVMKDQEALTAAEAATLELRRDLEHANHELAQRTHGMFMAQEAGKDLARQLDKANAMIEKLAARLRRSHRSEARVVPGEGQHSSL